MTTSNTLHSLLAPLGWQAFLPAFELLLQRFAGTEAWLDEEADGLAECLSGWLQSLLDNPRPLRVALLEVRHWPVMHFHATNSDGREWDYCLESFRDFSMDAQPITKWVSPARLPPGHLARAVGFLRHMANGAAGQPC